MLNGAITLPSSKSISNRVLMIKALSGLDIEITNLSEAKDTQTLLQLLTTKGLTTFDVGDAGTAMRFLTAFLAMKEGEFILTGSERMQQRPIKILVDALKILGAEIEYLNNEGFPPLKIKGKKLSGGEITIDGSVSSQYISALMLVAPYLKNGLTINFKGQLTSKPYIEMTAEMMRYFGVELLWKENSIEIKVGEYVSNHFLVEADWSASSYWYSMVALAKEAEITLFGLQQNSLQGDSVVAKIYENFGVKTEYFENGVRLTKTTNFKSREVGTGSQTSNLKLSFSNCPDLAQTVAVTCAALNIPAKLTGLHTLRIKETDRITALQTELCKLGYQVNIENDDLIILPSLRTDRHSYESRNLSNGNENTIKTYNDHRMAMAFAPLALLYPIHIEDEDVVVKSYPNFWEDLKKVGFEMER
jgi:3-phosphoshikimate 1-carboxyvinyltransferase